MRTLYAALLIAGLLAPACATGPATQMPEAPRLVMFIGVDISGSFMHGKYFNDSIQFLARYIHAHLYGLGGMEKPHSLFVGSIGGVKQDEAKTLYPIEMFQDRSGEQIESQLKPISIVLLTDGDPDMGGSTASEKFHNLSMSPLEGLSRNITVRVLYTDAVIGKSWRDEVPRKRIKVWTQDAVVMAEWKDPKTLL